MTRGGVVAPFAQVDATGQLQLAQVQVLDVFRLQRIADAQAAALGQQGDHAVIGHVELVQHQAQVHILVQLVFVEQFLPVLRQLQSQLGELLLASLQSLESGGQGLFVINKTGPAFALLGIVVVVEVDQQIFQLAGDFQRCRGSLQHGRTVVGLLVQIMNDAMLDGHV